MDSLWALFDKDLEEGGRRAFFPLCLQLLSTWLLMTERKWIKMSYLNWKSATEQKRFTLPNPSVNFTRKRKRRHHWFICTVILGGLFFQSCTFEHSEHLWIAIWFSGRFTSHPVRWKLFTPHLLAQSTLSTRTELWKYHRHSWEHASSIKGNVGGLKLHFRISLHLDGTAYVLF